MTLQLLDTFSGIGGFSYAAERLVGGYQTVAFVEREPFCQSILRKHWSDVPIYDDITTFNPAPGSADIICGGFPCQDISTAGKQAGIKEGTRSGLFYELMRVVRLVGPRYIVLENVAAITSNGMDTVLGALAEAGFDAEWACIPAAAVGACHRRDRWWCVAYAKGSGTRQYQSHARGQRDGAGLPRDRASDKEIPTAYASRLLSDGQQAEHGGQSGGRAVSESGDGDGADAARRGDEGPDILLEMLKCRRQDAAHTIDIRPRRQDVPLPSLHRADQGREIGLGAGIGIGPQQWQRWPTGRQSLNPDWRSYVSEPCLRRGDDGLSGRVDRLKALGNAVVPQVAAIPLARVLELERVRAANPAAHPPCP
jgi:DNA (cytosine-5)-methyltransferase 1